MGGPACRHNVHHEHSVIQLRTFLRTVAMSTNALSVLSVLHVGGSTSGSEVVWTSQHLRRVRHKAAAAWSTWSHSAIRTLFALDFIMPRGAVIEALRHVWLSKVHVWLLRHYASGGRESAVGENAYSSFGCQQILSGQVLDYVGPLCAAQVAACALGCVGRPPATRPALKFKSRMTDSDTRPRAGYRSLLDAQ